MAAFEARQYYGGQADYWLLSKKKNIKKLLHLTTSFGVMQQFLFFNNVQRFCR